MTLNNTRDTPCLPASVVNNSSKWDSLTALLIATCLATVFTACSPSYYFDEEKSIPNGQWAYADSLAFGFSIPDTSATFNLYLVFEYADTFSSQNLYLKLHTVFPDGKRLHKVKSFDFFDAQGAPLGKCSGRRCRLQVALQENAYFNQPGDYAIVLEQFTRQESLPGVYSAGLILEKNKAPKEKQ